MIPFDGVAFDLAQCAKKNLYLLCSYASSPNHCSGAADRKSSIRAREIIYNLAFLL